MGKEMDLRCHQLFLKKVDKLANSTRTEDQELAAILKEEINGLHSYRLTGQPYPGEYRLRGKDLRDIGYIRKYSKAGGNRFSIRIYFTIQDGALWILDYIMKRRDDLEKGEVKSLKKRLQDVRSES